MRRLLEPRSIAVVGASDRPGSFGDRLTREVLRSPAAPTVSLVNPKYTTVHGRPCVPSLLDLDDAVDLVILGVPDIVLTDQLAQAAERGDASALAFGTAHGLGDELASIAHRAGMAMCGGGSMGYVNNARGIRAIGYVERFPLEPGGVAFITHSGSVFSSTLRTHRRLDFSLVVSAGQELVTSMADYLDYALDLDETRVVGLFVETMRDADALQAAFSRAAAQDVPVVALTVGGSPTGRALVAAHSGAIAGDDAAWEALFAAHGVHRVHSLDEMADTLELFGIGRRVLPSSTGRIATVHDSGGQRALVADRADVHGVPFAALSPTTTERLGRLLDPGLQPTNPLDVWGRGVDTEALVGTSLELLADDDAVAVVVAALDLAEEYDGDESYPRAVEALLHRTAKPVVVLSNIASAVDQRQAARLRAVGVPVLEGTDSGLRALRHLLDQARPPETRPEATVDEGRARRWRTRLAAGDLDASAGLELLRDYGIATPRTVSVDSRAAAVAAAHECGFPVVLKTDAEAVLHKTDVDGVRTGLADADAVAARYEDMSRRLGARAVVQAQVPSGVELALGVVRDPLLGPIVVVGVGGTLVEVLRQRQVALPPLSSSDAERLLDRMPRLLELLAGVRGGAAADRAALTSAIVALGQLAVELGDEIEALDVNPLICRADGVFAVDALVVRRLPAGVS
jgi:acyl-CoA synthetase (NDP forming)